MESSRRSKSAKAGPKLERKYVEKHRRIYMQYLINQLYSMLPAQASTSKDTVAVTDQVHAAEKYIASLDKKLEKKKKHLEQLKMGTKITKSPPQIEFHEMGPNMVVVLITGLDSLATFNNIIRLCHKEVNFRHLKIYCEQILARPKGTSYALHLFLLQIKTANSTTAMAFRNLNDVPCKNAIVAASANLSYVGPITQCKFKTSGLHGSEYFT
ncbi:transcription factor bHLH162-like [Lycium ferocissimum]|uniref:transcription factor bHLH162-like n=1 Tax=Lycium ferocissimum TaxID=112874 RepID=UPI00281539D4|nr:transcription factor bHLH162-like [Lycium ferocissimum]